MQATRSMATIVHTCEFKESVEYLTNTVSPQCIKDEFLQDNSKELIIEYRGNESDAAMITDPTPSYSEYPLSHTRHILQETDLDKEFLGSVYDIGQENLGRTDKHTDNVTIECNNNTINGTKTFGEFFTFTDQQLSGHFQTNYDVSTGETRVKLGVYDYPIDIASCFTDAEKCLQENNFFPEDIPNESALEELYSVANYGRVRQPIPLSDISSTCTQSHSCISFPESSRSQSVPDIDNKIDQDSTVLRFTQLHSYNYRKHNFSNDERCCGENTIENSGMKLNIPSIVSVLNVPTNNRQLSYCASTTTECSDQRVPPITQTSALFSGNHTTNTCGINSDLSSTYSFANSTMPDLNNVPVSNSATCDMTGLAFPDREFKCSKPLTPTVKMSKHKRMIEKTPIVQNQSQKPIKREASLLIPYMHESLLSSSKIWKSTQCTNPKHKKRLTRGCKLWEFIRNLLLSRDTNPSMIRWEDRDEGTFKLVQSKAIAQMWGMKKGNRDMTYEKLSRAMRYYYKKQVFQPVLGKRLIYRFGPRATGWRDDE